MDSFSVQQLMLRYDCSYLLCCSRSRTLGRFGGAGGGGGRKALSNARFASLRETNYISALALRVYRSIGGRWCWGRGPWGWGGGGGVTPRSASAVYFTVNDSRHFASNARFVDRFKPVPKL